MTTEPMQAVRAFIAHRNPALGPLCDDLDLIDSRAINSLAFVEFIFLLEELTGQPIDPEDLDLDDFRTLSALNARFFKKEEAAR
ncbi:acyl carrier protein [Streptomyces sp. NPDC002589]|uniref:acyl carrier protein n=1 Tax=Streptomyces sp. NPDC002589 TaxID=3154420 RepID=UPI00331B436B